MTSPPEEITVICPKCAGRYKDWYRASMNLELDPFDEEYIKKASTATCPHCGHTVCLDVLVVTDEGWQIGPIQSPEDWGAEMTIEEILDYVRKLIRSHSGDDPDRWCYANRFVFARLNLDERKTKAGIKKQLLDANSPCHYCKESFESKKGIHLHRVDDDRGYADDNCVLMHPECHERYHAENIGRDAASEKETAMTDIKGKSILVRKSKFYEDMPYLYWWDISPNLSEKLDRYEAVDFLCKDTGRYCRIPLPDLRKFLTPDQQTTRGEGNWGIKVMINREDELAFEPGTGSGDRPQFLSVTWLNESEA